MLVHHYILYDCPEIQVGMLNLWLIVTVGLLLTSWNNGLLCDIYASSCNWLIIPFDENGAIELGWLKVYQVELLFQHFDVLIDRQHLVDVVEFRQVIAIRWLQNLYGVAICTQWIEYFLLIELLDASSIQFL